MIRELCASLPNLSLVFMGAGYDDMGLYVGNTWFISSMLLAMLVLYPLLLKYYHVATKLLFPVLSIVSFGYMSMNCENLALFYTWTGMFYLGTIRAVAEMALGASLFEIVRCLKKRETSRISAFGRLLLTFVKYASYLVEFAIAYKGTDNPMLHVVLYLSLAIVLTMSGYCYSIPDCALVRTLGKISIPIFIFHGFMRLMVRDLLGGRTLPMASYIALSVGAVVVSILLKYFTDFAAQLLEALFRKTVVKVDSGAEE